MGWENGARTVWKSIARTLDRNIDMMNKYNPDMVYYDDTGMPLWPVSDVGLKAVAHFYNKSIKDNNGKMKQLCLPKF